jgi:DNA-binding NarL/FixJ family response regulator
MGDVRRPDVRVTMIDSDVTFVDAVLRYCARYAPGIVIAHITDITDLAAHSERSRPDVITLDPEQLDDPVGGVLASSAVPTRPSVIALTMMSNSAVVAELASAGASGWVGKHEPVAVLVDAVRAVHRGEGRYPSEHLGAVMRTLRVQAARPSQRITHCTGHSLTEREQEVLGHLLSGATPREVAHRMQLSTNTIRSHRRRIEAKLGVHG